MLWRGIVLAALGVGFGIAAVLCLKTETRLNIAINAIFTAENGSDQTSAQSGRIAALSAQLSTATQFATPLAAGSLLCVVALLVVLAWRWQAPRPAEQN